VSAAMESDSMRANRMATGVGRSGTRVASIAIALVIWACLSPASASAAFGVAAFDGSVTANPAGDPFTQAGGHPYGATAVFKQNTAIDGDGRIRPDGGGFKNVVVDLPAGFAGDPTAVPTCPVAQFVRDPRSSFNCPASTQVGLATPLVALDAFEFPLTPVPIYNLDPPPGVAAEFGFSSNSVIVFLDAGVRPDDYGLQIRVRNTSQVLPVIGSSVTFWGVPGDPAHDAERIGPGCDSGCPISTEPVAFISNPTSCPAAGTGLTTTLQMDSWANPGAFAAASFTSHDNPGYSFANQLPPDQWGPVLGTTGCDRLSFDPSIDVRPDSRRADSPSGLAVDLAFPQQGLSNPQGLAPAHLKSARVTLPEGMTISPSSADGLDACSDDRIGIGNDDAVSCPEAAKIGTVRATTPLLENPLEGSIYVGSQKSDDPESGQMFRIFLVLESKERGVLVKLTGEVRANRETGRLETTVANNPQLPVSKVELRFKGGPRAPLATSTACGPQTVEAQFVSWSGKTVNRSDSFTIDCPGTQGFAPTLSAGMLDPKGGAFSPFFLRVDRPDGQQFMDGLAVRTPPGLIAKLKGLPLCANADASAGTCPIESRIGTATVKAGPGNAPFFITDGTVSLTGPYKGAPYGLSVAVRAVAGPFDLGTVVVRQAIFVDPDDAHLTVISDPLPTILKGVPVRLRSVAVAIDRPSFTMNPTSCAEKQIGATMHSTGGLVSDQTIRFQVGDCQALPFNPKLALRLTGKRQTKDGGHPGLRARLTQAGGQANLKKLVVKLPLSLALDPNNASGLCEFAEGQKPDPKCPESSIVGHAKAVTPVLNRPLEGPVYFVKGVRIDRRTGRQIRTLPTLLMALRGEVALNVRQSTSVSRDKLVATIPTIPDAPVRRFDLNLIGGRNGILTVTRPNLCRADNTAVIQIDAQNGKTKDTNPKLSTPCKSRQKRR
jgi:hypothetical protein